MTVFKFEIFVDNERVAKITFEGAIEGNQIGYDIDSVNYELKNHKEFDYEQHLKELVWVFDSIIDDILEEG